MPCCDLNQSREEEKGLGQTGQQKRAKELFQNLEGVVEAEAAEHHQLRVEVVEVEVAEVAAAAAAEEVVVVEEEEEEGVEVVEVVEKKLDNWLNPRGLGLRVDI